jgi:nucleoredoxin
MALRCFRKRDWSNPRRPTIRGNRGEGKTGISGANFVASVARVSFWISRKLARLLLTKAAEVKEQIAAQAKQRAIEAEESRKFDTLYQSQLARERASVRPPAATSNVIQSFVKGDLMSWHNGGMARFDDEALEKKKLVVLFFSAQWCPPCRKFTPQLVDYYNRVAPQHPEFEIIFVSFDRSQFAMETYMREANMPWPAIDYQKVSGKDAIRKYAGEKIPCLVLVDASGKVISDSFAGKEYLGPAKVLSDLDAIFTGNSSSKVAQGR